MGQTVASLKSAVRRRGLSIVAHIDHARDAGETGLNMPPTQLLIFGNPVLGTPLMLASPTTAIDLPLKVLVWQDVNQTVWLTYNDAGYLQRRHAFPTELVGNIDGLGSLCQEVARCEAD